MASPLEGDRATQEEGDDLGHRWYTLDSILYTVQSIPAHYMVSLILIMLLS